MLRPRPTRIAATALFVAVAVALTLPPLAAEPAAAATAASSCGKWHSIPTATGIPEAAFFAGAQISSTDVWAGGRQGTDGLLEHWDGHAWTQASAPFPSNPDTEITGLAAISSDDIWAVGSSNGLPGQPFILHFDGSAWSLVPSPAPASGTQVALAAVSASGQDDVWAAGYVLDTSTDQYTWTNLVEHWDGQAWSVVDAPSLVPGSDTLSGVTAIAPDDVWVVGNNGMTAHWNGNAWTVVSNPF
ncbi:MAG TPA: hypothetical protein VGJ67_03575, partial [Actinomycetota bacterium]